MKAQCVTSTIVAAPDGRELDVRFMDDGSIHITSPAGQPWTVYQHRTGMDGTRLQLRPATVPDKPDQS